MLMRELNREEEGMLEVNKQYQEAIKIVINLVTASLVLPVVFVKNILAVDDKNIKGSLCPWAYWSWGFLIMSLLACVGFYYFSTKFTKAVYKSEETRFWGIKVETWRDSMAAIAAPFFLAGLGFLLYFFLHELSMKPAVMHG